MEVVLTKYLLFHEETSLQTESKVGVPHSINMVLLLFLPVNTHLTTNETLSGKTSIGGQFKDPDYPLWVSL
jgi:hypothetical protein